MAEEAARLNRPFFTYIQQGRPFVTLKAALSLDGMVAARRGARTALTGPEANALVHQERAEVDAIAHRVGDAARRRSAPDGARRVPRPAAGARRVRSAAAHAADGAAVLDAGRGPGDRREHRVDASARAGARADALAAAGAELEFVEESPDDDGEVASAAFLRAALARLAARDVMSLIVEGGPVLHGAFWRAGLVDRVELFVSPRAVGPDGVAWAALPDGSIASLAELTARPVGDDVRIEGFVLEGSRGSEGSAGSRFRGTCSRGSLSRWGRIVDVTEAPAGMRLRVERGARRGGWSSARALPSTACA